MISSLGRIWIARFLLMAAAASLPALSQTSTAPPSTAQTSTAQTNPITIDLPDAVARAKKYGLQIESAGLAAKQAAEDRKQARAATLPQVSAFNQFIYTQGNGTPSGVFVANDGVHVYNEQLQAHEELLALLRKGEIRRALAAQATAAARVEVAARGLNTTVVQGYYAIVSAQRRFKNAQTSLAEAERFLDISQKQEKGGEVAHADVIKAQLQEQQRQRDLQDAQLAIEKAKIALGVLIFPDPAAQDFSVVDDAANAPALPPSAEAQAQAGATNPDIRVAQSSLRESSLGVTIAKYAYLPSFGLDVFYGINANQFAFRTNYPTAGVERSNLPNFTVPYRQNLGYTAQATLTIPLWNWGSIRSKVRQASLKEQQARLDLTLAKRTLQSNLATAYKEAQAAQAQVDSLRQSSELSQESLRLTLLRYQAGESTALEVVDAQTTLIAARNAYDDGLVRYRVALANLQNLTGTF